MEGLGAAREVGASSPLAPPAWHELRLRLAYRAPLNPSNLFGHLVATAVPGVEEWRAGAYRRTIQLPNGPGVVALRPRPDHVEVLLHLADLRDRTAAVGRCRFLLDLDADPVAVDAALSADPILAPLVAAGPGRRVPRTVDGAEFAIRAVLGQQVSTAAARTHAARLVLHAGKPITDPAGGGLTHLFPTPEVLTGLGSDALAAPAARFTTLTTVAAALASGDLDLSPGADRVAARTALAAIRGVGPWTIETVAMRALADPDAFPATDLGIRRAAASLGLDRLQAHAERWRPWRSYATQYLWAVLGHPINHLPGQGR